MRHLWLILLLVCGLTARLNLLYLYSPYYWGDAKAHLNYIGHIASGGGLPTKAAPMSDSLQTYENIQPPLYYTIAASVVSFCFASGFNPISGLIMLSLVLWVGGALLIYSASRSLLAVAIYVALPGWIWQSCAISNDVLLVFWGALMVWLLARGGPVWAVSLVAALACGTKLHGLLLLIPVVLVFVRRGLPARLWAVLCGPALIITGLVVFRNLTLWSDITGQGYVITKPVFHTIPALARHYVRTFFMAWHSDNFSFIELRLLWPIIACGFGWLIVSWRGIPRQYKRFAFALAAFFVLTSAAVIGNGLSLGRAQGRLGYVALPALCVYAGLALERKRSK